MENEIMTAPEVETIQVVDIQFRPGQKVYYFDPVGLELNNGDAVIIDTARGLEYGICASAPHQISVKEVVAPLRPVVRLANDQDKKIVAENRLKERKAHELCLKKIDDLGLDMQLVSVECAFDCSKLLFFFTADERVDFRELVKNLAFAFHTRIELRQIGVRDKAKMVGGLGICGRPFCCSSFLDDFQPVSIKMAKTQNLSLNPTKISGTCGRLMCCLKYEQEAYEDLLRRSPKEESFVDTPEGRGTVIEVSLLRQKVKVRMEDDPDTLSVFSVDEIAVLRNGKAKKNDPPIPADLAPISGGGKRRRLDAKKEEKPAFLDPIKFRYREDAVVDETENPSPAEQPDAGADRSGRRRRPRSGNPRQEERSTGAEKASQPEHKKGEGKKPHYKKPEAKKASEPQAEAPTDAPGAETENKPRHHNYRRRPNFHHRKKTKAQE